MQFPQLWNFKVRRKQLNSETDWQHLERVAHPLHNTAACIRLKHRILTYLKSYCRCILNCQKWIGGSAITKMWCKQNGHCPAIETMEGLLWSLQISSKPRHYHSKGYMIVAINWVDYLRFLGPVISLPFLNSGLETRVVEVGAEVTGGGVEVPHVLT